MKSLALRVSCAALTHGDAGPVMVTESVATIPAHTCDACDVVAVLPEDQDEDAEPALTEVLLSGSPAIVAASPLNSITEAKYCGELPPVKLTATDVWPPAQFGSAQIPVIASVVEVPALSSDAKLPAAPPSVTPLTDGFVPPVVSVAMHTTRQLPAVVGLGSARVSGEVLLSPWTDWTKAGIG